MYVRSLEIAGLRLGSGQLILFGGAPCQGFSYSNPRHRNKANPINGLFLEFLRYVDLLTPNWVVFENVPRIACYGTRLFPGSVKEKLKQRDYSVIDGILNAADHGVPQNRGRYLSLRIEMDAR